jgi:hypothetical protein
MLGPTHGRDGGAGQSQRARPTCQHQPVPPGPADWSSGPPASDPSGIAPHDRRPTAPSNLPRRCSGVCNSNIVPSTTVQTGPAAATSPPKRPGRGSREEGPEGQQQGSEPPGAHHHEGGQQPSLQPGGHQRPDQTPPKSPSTASVSTGGAPSARATTIKASDSAWKEQVGSGGEQDRRTGEGLAGEPAHAFPEVPLGWHRGPTSVGRDLDQAQAGNRSHLADRIGDQGPCLGQAQQQASRSGSHLGVAASLRAIACGNSSGPSRLGSVACWAVLKSTKAQPVENATASTWSGTRARPRPTRWSAPLFGQGCRRSWSGGDPTAPPELHSGPGRGRRVRCRRSPPGLGE